ncbi:MAG: toll/interleukin-1 receptor domain-containing protein [Armatimonadetes bacterium]|nr:toll/interleukin-1 receptor domain-containing protein [Armatimonadota bacterium]
MQVFLCHSSRDKCLIREIRRELPKRVNDWLDEDALVLGDPIPPTLERVIKTETDYVVLFVSSNSINSTWVQQELVWAFERERATGKHIILPVLLEDVWDQVPEGLRDRVYLPCLDQAIQSVRGLADRLRDQLASIVDRDLAEAQQKLKRLQRTLGPPLSSPSDRVLVAQHAGDRTAVFLSIDSALAGHAPCSPAHRTALGAQFEAAVRKAFGEPASFSVESNGVYLVRHPAPEEAFAAAVISFARAVCELNVSAGTDLRHAPLFFRVGIDFTADGAKDARRACPVGNVAVSPDLRCQLKQWRDVFRPLSVEARQYVLCQRPLLPQEEPRTASLNRRQIRALPALRLLDWSLVRPAAGLAELSKELLAESVVVFGDTSWSPRGCLMSAATSDAVGMMEAMSMRGEDNLRVGIDEWEDTADLVAARNVLFVGSGATNTYGLVLNDLLTPIHFVVAEGRPMDCITASSRNGDRVHFGPHTGDGVRKGHDLSDCAGLLIGARSVFNPERTMLWAAGINGMGTQAVAGLLKDLLQGRVRLPDAAIGCVVVPAVPGKDLKEYYRRLRVSKYQILHMVDAEGLSVPL